MNENQGDSSIRREEGEVPTIDSPEENKEENKQLIVEEKNLPIDDHGNYGNERGSKSDMKSASSIDRLKTCPFLVRCFWNNNKHNQGFDYRNASKRIYPDNEIQIYTWLNASMKEIVTLLQDTIIPSKERNWIISISVVYVDQTKNGHFSLRKVRD